jgi:cytochrome c-type biogenesis protein CcmF
MPLTGDLFIYLAAVCSLTSLFAYILVWRGRDSLLSLSRTFYQLSTVFIVGTLGIMLYLILTHDFTVKYVYSYSSTDLSLGLLISTLWGGQEGTFLLWIFYTSILGLVMMRSARQFEKGNMVFLNLFLLAILLILIKKSPFELMPVYQTEGAGLNPLLQNYWMVIHPPIMFLGFSGVVFPFCFAMTALVERRYATWSEAARRWTMFAWTALGASLVMGGLWAYETLGWGGFWAWDPVENSSLIPWIFLTTQVHSLFIKRHRRGLMRFSIIAVCMSFWAVMYGTFLTRSGVLADFSVHSFVDLGINQFLVGGLLAFVLLGTGLVIYRWRDIKPEPSYSKVNSRSYIVTLGIVILFLGGWLVLLGTSAPLLTRFTDNPSNVGLPYYFVTMTPVAIAILMVVALFPVYRWNKGLSKKRLLLIGIGSAILTMTLLVSLGVTVRVIYLLLFGTAAWALVSNGYVFVRSLTEGKLKAGYLSHVGLAIALIGAGASAGFDTKRVINLPQGRTMSAFGYDITFSQAVDTPKGFDCHVILERDNEKIAAVLPHEFPKNAEGVMKKPFVKSYLSHDLYLSPNSFRPGERTDPGELMLLKGGSKDLGKYRITFHDFEVNNHGESEMRAAALMSIVHDGKSEDIAPELRVSDGEVTPVAASFDGGEAAVTIIGVRPEDGGVVVKLEGESLPAPAVTAAVLSVEVSKKPLIVLFWAGTIIIFLGGIMSTVKRRRRKAQQFDRSGESNARTVAELTSDAA